MIRRIAALFLAPKVDDLLRPMRVTHLGFSFHSAFVKLTLREPDPADSSLVTLTS